MRKEWWSDELATAAKAAHTAEKEHVRLVKAKREAGAAKTQFLSLQKQFDKLVKKMKRQWQRNQIFNLEKINDSDPNAF